MYHSLICPMLLDTWVAFQPFVIANIFLYFEVKNNPVYRLQYLVLVCVCVSLLKNDLSFPVLSAEKSVFVSPSLGYVPRNGTVGSHSR